MTRAPEEAGRGDLVSIVVPCYNEERYIEDCLRSVLAFTVPDGVSIEVLVLDGGSTDATPAIVQRISCQDARVRLIPNPQRSQSFALNIGIRAAAGKWVMRLDAHSVYPRDYLGLCHSTAVRTGAENAGGIVITEPGGDSYGAALVQALTTHKFGVGDSGFRTGASEGPADTVPFGFFRRDVFDRLGMFDERLLRAQDYEFNRRIVRGGGKVWLNPNIQVRYFNQPSLVDFYRKQLFLEAPYNAYLWYVAPHAFAARHAVTAVFAAGVVIGAVLAAWHPLLALAYFAVLALYGVLSVLSAVQQAARYRRIGHIVVLPACFFGFHFLHGIGVWGGLFRLLSGTAPVQRRAA